MVEDLKQEIENDMNSFSVCPVLNNAYSLDEKE
jgi:hypothetical protein